MNRLGLLIFFVLFPSGLWSRTLDKTVVSVNSDIILESDIDRFQKKLQSKAFQELFGGVDPSAVKDKNIALQLLVEETIVDQQVKRLELKASDQEVEAQIRTIIKRNGISESQLAERLKQLGTTMSEYKDGLRRQIERRNLIDREIKPSMEVTDEQLRHFYLRQNQGSGKDLQYHLAHILVGSSQKAAKLYQSLRGTPEKFEEVAKSSSEDSGTAATGGDLGFLSLSSLSTELKSVVTKLPVGAVSSPVKTSGGYHLLKLLETRASDFATLSKEKKEALRGQMINSEVEKKMVLWLERKKAEAHIVRMGDKHASE
ncbi:MAG: peptidylprolyl isomerase [Pseudomonadota bacterium]